MSKIEWTDVTWNPVVGCSKVSRGCSRCYAERMAKRLVAMGKEQYVGTVDGHGRWTGAVNWAGEDVLLRPLGWRKPRRVFVGSMTDLFHPSVPLRWLRRIFWVMSRCPQHVFQVLTKRPERAAEVLGVYGPEYWDFLADGPLRNVWVGTSVEDQAAADARVPELLRVPAAVRFLSCEPLLGPVDLGLAGTVPKSVARGYSIVGDWIGWVIVGGESGPRSRPMHPDWARGLRDQCVEAEVPFFFKQWGDWQPSKTRNVVKDSQLGGLREHVVVDSADRSSVGKSIWYAFPADRSSANDVHPEILDIEVMHRVGKKVAGRMLDGCVWDEWPVDAEGAVDARGGGGA